MSQRFDSEVTSDEAQDYWTATYLLMGLRYEREQARRLLQGVRNMRESVTYQEILDEGRQEGERMGRQEGAASEAMRLILMMGTRRFGSPSALIQSRIESIRDIARLESLLAGILDVESWDDLMGRG